MRTFIILFILVFFTSLIEAKPQAPYQKLPTVEKTDILDRLELSTGFNSLLPYMLPSPDQGDAGTCLFMAHTGVIEWWLAKSAGQQYPQIAGDFDLSERLSANLKTLAIGSDSVNNWRTDTIYRFNSLGYSFRNSDYPFTQGWYSRNELNQRVPTRADAQGAYYGINYNWIAEFQNLNAPKVMLPKFKREVLYADPSQNQWNITGAPKDIVETVKRKLKENNAPIITIYNHMGYWHTVVILGYNDSLETDCPYVTRFPTYMNERAQALRAEAKEQTDPAAKRKLIGKARKFEKRGSQAASAFDKENGCQTKGVFYVRDSIYPDETLPLYDYDATHEGEERHYSSTIIAREYQWLRIFANHIYQISLQ